MFMAMHGDVDVVSAELEEPQAPIHTDHFVLEQMRSEFIYRGASNMIAVN